jgi:hypothetical protein
VTVLIEVVPAKKSTGQEKKSGIQRIPFTATTKNQVHQNSEPVYVVRYLKNHQTMSPVFTKPKAAMIYIDVVAKLDVSSNSAADTPLNLLNHFSPSISNIY